MGRPRKSDEEKRVQMNIRLLPADRDKLAQLAEAAKRPLAAYAEAVLVGHLRRMESTSLETRRLTDLIETKIAELEKQAKGRWHVTLKAWAAVSQMLTHVLEADRPERVSDDEFVTEAFNLQRDAEQARRAIVEKLADLGVAVNEDPKPRKLLGTENYRGLFGRVRQGSSREWEVASIRAIPDEEVRGIASSLFEDLLAADEAVNDADDRFTEALKPYIEAEQEGRLLGRAAFVATNALVAMTPRIIKWPYASKS